MSENVWYIFAFYFDQNIAQKDFKTHKNRISKLYTKLSIVIYQEKLIIRNDL